MYSPADIVDALRNPYKLGRELNLLYHRRLRLYDHNPRGVDVMAEDWDNLLILDACRHDEFRRLSDLRGELEWRRSRGSSSVEFIRGNLAGRSLHDTVCVTANAYYRKLADGLDLEFHKLIDLQSEEYWDDQFGTVRPEIVRKHAARAADAYPKKRLLVHFIQPHKPYLGPTGVEHFSNAPHYLMSAIKSGEFEVSDDVLREAYRENLAIVLEHVETLLGELSGMTVVTSDHGEMLGERHRPFPMRDFGHPHGIYTDILTKVPWHTYKNGTRREIQPDEPTEFDEHANATQINERLRQLGYME